MSLKRLVDRSRVCLTASGSVVVSAGDNKVGFWSIDGQFGRQWGGPAPTGGQLTVGNAPVGHRDSGTVA